MKSTNTLQLSGRIDSVNAAEWERKLTQQLDLEKETIFDAEALEYISSAGLRVLRWKCRKVCRKNPESSMYRLTCTKSWR